MPGGVSGGEGVVMEQKPARAGRLGGGSHLLVESELKKSGAKRSVLESVNVDRIIQNLPKSEVVESNETSSRNTEQEVSQDPTGLRVAKPVSIKQQIMLNLNNDSIVIGEPIMLENEKQDESGQDKKVTQKIMETFTDEIYKPYENNAEDNFNYLLDQKLNEQRDPEVVKKGFGVTRRISREDLDQFIRNGLRGTDRELKNRAEFQAESRARDQQPRPVQKRVQIQEKASLPRVQNVSAKKTDRQMEKRIQEEMSKGRESDILRGMRDTVQTEFVERVPEHVEMHAPTPQYEAQERRPLTIDKASIGPDIARYTHDRGNQPIEPIIVNGEKYYYIEELEDYDPGRGLPKETAYESKYDQEYVEYRNTLKSKSSRGTYRGIGSMVMGGKSGMRLNYQNHLDDLYKGKRSSKYY